MAHHNDGGVNPLRPYYIPPTIGEPVEVPLPPPGPRAFAQGNSTSKYATKARDIFSDIDYKDYISEPSPSVVQTVKELLDELLWKYTSVLMAQPFEVAKTLLQVRVQDDLGGLVAAAEVAAEEARQKQIAARERQLPTFDDEVWNERKTNGDSDSDAEEMAAYFSHPHHPRTPPPTLSRSSTARSRAQLDPTPSPAKPVSAHHLSLRGPDSVLEVIGQLWQKEAAWGVWKGSNATFIYSVLQSLLENWSRSLLSALFNVPDLGVKIDQDRLIDLASPYPWASLCVAAAASVVTGLILSPLDLIRTRMIVTSTSRAPRRTLSALRSLPSYLCPSSLFFPTVLHSLVHPLLTLSTPLVLRSQFMIDKDIAPTTFSIAKFCSSTLALFLKLPLETVLRRGQVAVLSSPEYVQALEIPHSGKGKKIDDNLETIVPLGEYNGFFGTMYTIINEEGSHALPTAAQAKSKAAAAAAARRGKQQTVSETVFKRGQGVKGLWRGWTVSWWGVVGLWTAGVLGGGGDGEF